MKGDINGGLILLEPSIEEEARLTEGLNEFDPVTEMAEQEFMGLEYGEEKQRNALPEKYNFQIHQLYLVQRTLPAGEEQPCSFHGMIQNPEEIRLFHYSAERKPSYVLMHIMDEETGNLSTLGVSCQQDYPAGSSGTPEWKPCVPEYTEPSAQK